MGGGLGCQRHRRLPKTKNVGLLALPATVTYLFGRSFVSICLIFIGRMGDLELAAAALANTTMNVSGLSVLVGMGTAAEAMRRPS